MSVPGNGSESTAPNSTYAKGEKCATALFTETEVGNDTPECFLDKFAPAKTFFHRSNVKGNAPLRTFTPLTFLL